MNKVKLFWSSLKTKEVKASIMVEIILIIVVLIAMVALFKAQLLSMVGDIFDKITRDGMAI